MNKKCEFCVVLLGGFKNLLFTLLDADYYICNDYAFLAKKKDVIYK